MKTKVNIALTFALVLASISLGFSTPKKATIKDSKTIHKSFKVNPDAQFNLHSREADVVVTTWDKNEIDVTVTLTVEAYDRDELDEMLEQMNVVINGTATNVTVKDEMKINRQTTINGRTSIRTNGKKIKIKKFSYTYAIKMPKTAHVNIKNKFGNVTLDENKGKLNLELYENTLNALKAAPKDCVMNLKFCEVQLGELKNAEIKLYECKLNLVQVATLDLNAKFSKVTSSRSRDVTLSAYESKLNLGVAKLVSGKQSFGSLLIAEADEIKLTTYELKLTIGSVKNLELTNSKFSKITCGPLTKLKVVNAYENDMTIAEASTVNIIAKFSDLHLGELKESLVTSGYELDCFIGKLDKGFKKVSIDGKFSKTDITIPDGVGYKLDADVRFGDIKYPTSNLEVDRRIKDGSTQRVSAKTKNYSGESLISIRGYESDLTIH